MTIGKTLKIKRRNFLKFLLFGSGAFLLGRLLSALPSALGERGKIVGQTDFHNFKFVETGKRLTLYDRAGEEILVVEKDGF